MIIRLLTSVLTDVYGPDYHSPRIFLEGVELKVKLVEKGGEKTLFNLGRNCYVYLGFDEWMEI